MALHVALSDRGKPLFETGDSVDCACDSEKLQVIRTYLHERFPDRAVHEFHSRSFIVVPGCRPAWCANFHVISISDERSYYAVLTGRFLAQPLSELQEHLRWWDLASAMQVDRTVIVDGDGLSLL